MKELSVDVVKNELKRSDYSTNGMRVVLPIFFGIFILLWIALTWNRGILAFVSTGVCFGMLFILVIYMAVVSTSVSKSIEKRDFCIERVAVAEKKYKPGNAEDLPEFYFCFEKFGKFRLADKGNFDLVQIGDEYYVLLCGKSKKIRFIFNAEKWRISEVDFVDENGVYRPLRK